MKSFFKFTSVLLVLFAAVIGIAKENYQVVLLGDLHYDAEDIREGVDKLTPSRKRELRRNLAAWKENIPALLKATADYANKNDVLFTVQCGDITQGDEGKYEFAVTSFERILKLVTNDHTKPVYVVRGNHDCRGKGKQKACADVLWKYMKKQDVVFPQPQVSQTCYKIVGKDLFIFFDAMRADPKTIEAALKAKPDARHIFFVTHIPVMPCLFKPGNIAWICGGSKYNSQISTLLAKHNVIVLAAHTHATTYFDWKMPEGSLKQFVSFSIVRDPALKPEKITISGEKYFKDFEEIHYPKLGKKDLDALQNFLKDYIGKLDHCVHYKNTAGFNVLRIEGDKVFVDIYSGKSDKLIFTQQIK